MVGAICFSSFSIPRPSSMVYNGNENYTKPKLLTLNASLSDYPLASKIMVRNLSYSTNERYLQREFSKYGEIAEVKLVKDIATKRSKGYAFIQYTCHEHAMVALETMDHKFFDGRVISIDLAKPGKNNLGANPRTRGPPEKQDSVADQNTVL